MTMAASTGWTAAATATLVAAGVAAFVSLIGVWVSGLRQARGRRRDTYAEALAATMAYREFPYAIRRRRCEEEHRSDERVRISEALREVQTNLSQYQALLRIEGRRGTSEAYEKLVLETRRVAGGYMNEQWRADPIAEDSDVNTGHPFDYSVLTKYEDKYVEAVKRDLAPWRVWR